MSIKKSSNQISNTKGTVIFLDYDGSTSSSSTSAKYDSHDNTIIGSAIQAPKSNPLRSTNKKQCNESNESIESNESNESGILREKFDNLTKRLHNIESLLWDNRDKYTTSLDIVANREIEISRALDETKKLLRENREVCSQAFSRLFAKEEILEMMLKETKEILTENRRIYLEGMSELHRKNSESLEKLEKIKEFG
ncbi:MAG: hypothetical protein WD512_03800, partial [Candidatus Paceibacterota bacterium]